MDFDDIKHIESVPLSDAQLRTGGIEKIVLYSDLKQYQNINELLPNNGDCVTIFIKWDKNSTGHWTMMYKLKNKYSYFSSFGVQPDKDLNVISKCMRRILGEDVNEITRLLDGQHIEYSSKRYQKGETNTCGRWCILRTSFVKMNYSKSQFDKYLTDIKKLYPNMTFDEIVCMYVPIV